MNSRCCDEIIVEISLFAGDLIIGRSGLALLNVKMVFSPEDITAKARQLLDERVQGTVGDIVVYSSPSGSMLAASSDIPPGMVLAEINLSPTACCPAGNHVFPPSSVKAAEFVSLKKESTHRPNSIPKASEYFWQLRPICPTDAENDCPGQLYRFHISWKTVSAPISKAWSPAFLINKLSSDLKSSDKVKDINIISGVKRHLELAMIASMYYGRISPSIVLFSNFTTLAAFVDASNLFGIVIDERLIVFRIFLYIFAA